MKKLGILIISLVTIIGGLLLVFAKNIFGEIAETSEENVATTAATTASTSPSVIYLTQATSSSANIGSIRVTNAGNISAGKIFFKIENVGTANGAINLGTGNRVLKPTEFFVYNENLNPNVKPSGLITYDATGTEFIIDTVDA